jgi:uncharacterized protein
MNMFSTDKHLLYKCRVGSHAYGINTPQSDEDFAGVFIPTIDYFFGLRSFDQQVEQTGETDTTLYSLRKYANLAIANNPNVLELIFVDDSDVIYEHAEWAHLKWIRDKFLSQRCAKTYVGYASAQLHRIRSHRKWISQELKAMEVLLPLVHKGRITREWIAWRFGANMLTRLEQAVGQINSNVNSGANSGTVACKMDDYLYTLEGTGLACPDPDDSKYWKAHPTKGLIYQEHLYKEDKKKRDQYVTWMAERNNDRHESEIKFGYDTKHAAHLVRLLRTGYEVLTEGRLLVKRPDAAKLLSIRQGNWTYEELCDYADLMIDNVKSLKPNQFAVPETPDYDLINSTIVEITGNILYKETL